jgi:hypothetical protein
MSTKFEQLLDYLVNEEMEKANELFHEIVVEKSREIYENMIAEEAEEESVEEAPDYEEDESVEEGFGQDDGDEGETSHEIGGDASDDMLGDIEDPDAIGDEEPGDEEGHGDVSAGEEEILDVLQQLKAEFAALVHGADVGDEGDEGAEMSFGDEEDGEEPAADDEDEGTMMGHPAMEGRRVTREYVEKVGNDWEKNSQKTQGQYLGAGSGDKDGSPVEGRSPISSGSGKPTTGATAKNLNQGNTEGQKNTGTTPNKVNKGINPDSGEKFAAGIHNVDGAKSGVKTLSKVAGGHGAEKKGSGPGPVGSGTGDKAGQTSVRNDKSFLKHL